MMLTRIKALLRRRRAPRTYIVYRPSHNVQRGECPRCKPQGAPVSGQLAD